MDEKAVASLRSCAVVRALPGLPVSFAVLAALLIAAAAALTACGGSGGDTSAQEHARAVAYAQMWMASYPKSGNFAHVARANRIAPRLWHVELSWNGRKDWTCVTIQLDRFYVHETSAGASRGGVEARGGHCPKSS
jgi:hypothetical protein